MKRWSRRKSIQRPLQQKKWQILWTRLLDVTQCFNYVFLTICWYAVYLISFTGFFTVKRYVIGTSLSCIATKIFQLGHQRNQTNKPIKIIAAKGAKHVGQKTSAEKGTNVSVAVAINPSGQSVPPMYIFPLSHNTPIFFENSLF